jgi:hypothetical protein
MGFAHPGRAHQEHVGPGLQEGELGELLNEPPVHRGLEVEVKVPQALLHREVS